jgi:RHS repeat-associated protein
MRNTTQNTLQNRYPFGSSMVSFSNPQFSFAYGFNGMEKDDDVKGDGNSLDFGARIYDSRLGRWLSVDPLANSFPFESHYNFVSQNPIIYIDIEGNSKYVIFIEIDERTGEETKLRVLKDNKVLEKVRDNQQGEVLNYAYYDINEVHKTVIDKNGNKTTEVYEERGQLRARTTLPATWYANLIKEETEGEKEFDKGNTQIEWWGIRWTTSGGGSSAQGNSIETGRKFERSENIDMLLSVLGLTKTTASIDKGPVTISNVLKMLKSIWDAGKDFDDGLKKINKNQKEEKQYNSEGHGCSSCKKPKHDGLNYEDRQGNKFDGTTGDTLNKAKD